MIFMDVNFKFRDVLQIEGVPFIVVVRRLEFIGISLSMFSNKIPLTESLLSPISPTILA